PEIRGCSADLRPQIWVGLASVLWSLSPTKSTAAQVAGQCVSTVYGMCASCLSKLEAMAKYVAAYRGD
ncbi:MAG: hypothetical protein ABL893_10855, partial [Hyphomicrobium sp.]